MTQDTDTSSAAPILYEHYNRFKGKTFSAILSELPVKVKVRLDPKLGGGNALVDMLSYTIQLPVINNQHKLYFLACHELAHIILKFHDFVHVGYGPGYWIQEAWCDNFAIALTLAHFDIEAIGQFENPKKFFGMGTEVMDGNSRNAAVVKQIKTICHGLITPLPLAQFYESFA